MRMYPVSHLNATRHTHEQVMCPICMSHDAGNASCLSSYYVVATIRRLLKIIGLFCGISSVFEGSFAKETYHFMEPTNRNHPMRHFMSRV